MASQNYATSTVDLLNMDAELASIRPKVVEIAQMLYTQHVKGHKKWGGCISELDFIKLYNSRCNNVHLLFDATSMSLRTLDDTVLSISPETGKIILNAALSYQIEINLNAFSKQLYMSIVSHAEDGYAMYSYGETYSMRYHQSIIRGAAYTYQRSMLEFRTHLNQDILHLMNLCVVFNVEIYNELVNLSGDALKRVSQFMTIYRSYPYSVQTFKYIARGMSITEIISADILDGNPTAPKFVTELFKCNRIVTRIPPNIVPSRYHPGTADRAADGVIGAMSRWKDCNIIPKNWMDAKMSEILIGLNVKLDLSLYKVHVNGYKDAYKLLKKSVGLRTNKGKVFNSKLFMLKDTIDQIHQLGYNIPKSIPKLVQLSHLYHDQMVNYKADAVLSSISANKLKIATLPVDETISPDGYIIKQLLLPIDLSNEGKEMHHCVGGFASRVERGVSIIITFRSMVDEEVRSTCEFKYDHVSNRAVVVQHRKQLNGEVADSGLLDCKTSYLKYLNTPTLLAQIKENYTGLANASLKSSSRSNLKDFVEKHVIFPMKLGKTVVPVAKNKPVALKTLIGEHTIAF